MSLQEKLSALKQEFASKAPAKIQQAMHHGTESLRNSGIMDRVLKVGDRAPDFTLNNASGNAVRLQNIRSDGPVVLGFYRGKW